MRAKLSRRRFRFSSLEGVSTNDGALTKCGEIPSFHRQKFCDLVLDFPLLGG